MTPTEVADKKNNEERKDAAKRYFPPKNRYPKIISMKENVRVRVQLDTISIGINLSSKIEVDSGETALEIPLITKTPPNTILAIILILNFDCFSKKCSGLINIECHKLLYAL